jgi:hypothetical protein
MKGGWKGNKIKIIKKMEEKITRKGKKRTVMFLVTEIVSVTHSPSK